MKQTYSYASGGKEEDWRETLTAGGLKVPMVKSKDLQWPPNMGEVPHPVPVPLDAYGSRLVRVWYENETVHTLFTVIYRKNCTRFDRLIHLSNMTLDNLQKN